MITWAQKLEVSVSLPLCLHKFEQEGVSEFSEPQFIKETQVSIQERTFFQLYWSKIKTQ